jgi:hypothetical protein
MRLAWLNAAAWVITLAELSPRIGETFFDPWLAAIAIAGLASAVMWVRRSGGWRAAAIGAAVLYLVCYAVRLYQLEIEPLLAILPLPQALLDAAYVRWSSPMGRLSHGEVLDAAGELWREILMPFIQVGMLGALVRAR